jgi:hypothetical protein
VQDKLFEIEEEEKQKQDAQLLLDYHHQKKDNITLDMGVVVSVSRARLPVRRKVARR